MAIHARRKDADEARCGTPIDSDEATSSLRKIDCWQCIHIMLERPLPRRADTPEHAKLKEAKKTNDATQMVGRFMDWLEEQSLIISERARDCDELYPTIRPKHELLADFFEIDAGKLEAEKRALLEEQREINAAVDWARDEGRKTLLEMWKATQGRSP